MTPEAAVGLFNDDPITEPLTYPGRIPNTSGILIDKSFRALRAVTGTDPERWQVPSATSLDRMIEQHGGSPLSARVPVLAVGSNAAPSQLLRKFATRSVRPVIPATLADVSGLAPGISAHVSKPGYIPAVPVRIPGAVSRLFVLWLDGAQLDILDETEPNYRRRRIPTKTYSVKLESGVALPECFVYAGKHGCLTNTEGRPRRLGSQRTLIQELLDESARLRELCGESPDDFVAHAQDPDVRDAARRIFATEGWVGHPDPLVTRG